jgi:DNA-binding NarL/FixJ family response regulator
MGHRPQTHDVISAMVSAPPLVGRDDAHAEPSPVTVRRVALLDEPPLIVNGVVDMLGPYEPGILVRPVESGTGSPGPVHVTLYDPAGGPSRAATLETLLTDPVNGDVVVYSFRPSWTRVSEWLALGCAGVVDKGGSTTELVQVITSLRCGTTDGEALDRPHPVDRRPDAWPGKEQGLSPRESEMVRLIAAGLTNDSISIRTGLSINTVKTYIRSAYRKLDLVRRTEAVRWGLEHGMLGSPAAR